MYDPFPFNPFPDVDPSVFDKSNKKEWTEDFVSENLKSFGWDVFAPERDHGIDRIIQKNVCPKGHTTLDKSEDQATCSICSKTTIKITRFIQIKTRALNEELNFGYTLKTRDFPTDPRHVFLLFSDATDQFVLFPMYEYLFQRHLLTEEVDYSPHGVPSFRGENYKKNEYEITYPTCNKRHHYRYSTWRYVTDLNDTFTNNHVNLSGLQSISTPEIENNFQFLLEQNKEMKKNIFYYYCYSRPGPRTELLDPQDIEYVRNIIHQQNFNDIQFWRELNLLFLLQRNKNDQILNTTLQRTLAPYPLLKTMLTNLQGELNI